MSMYSNVRYLLGLVNLSTALFLLQAGHATAEYLCHSDVSYKWRKAQEEKDTTDFFQALEASGPDENAAKAALQKRVAAVRGSAEAECAAKHQNMSGCIASKLDATSRIHDSLSFSARKTLEEAVHTDCSAVQGSCNGSVASEPVCAEHVAKSAEASPTPDAKDAKAGKKDAKKK